MYCVWAIGVRGQDLSELNVQEQDNSINWVVAARVLLLLLYGWSWSYLSDSSWSYLDLGSYESVRTRIIQYSYAQLCTGDLYDISTIYESDMNHSGSQGLLLGDDIAS